MIQCLKTALCAGATLLVLLPGVATAQQTRILSYPEGGVPLGGGWDSSLVAKTSGSCIVGARAFSQEKGGQAVTAERSMVTDKYSHAQALNISADVQVKSITGSGVDAKAYYASKKDFDSTYLNVVSMVTVDVGYDTAVGTTGNEVLAPQTNPYNAPMTSNAFKAARPPSMMQAHQPNEAYFAGVANQRTMRDKNAAMAAALLRINHDAKAAAAAQKPSGQIPEPPPSLRGSVAGKSLGDSQAATIRLTDDMAALSAKNPAAFRKICGDGYVASIHYGGELAATYTFLSTSSQTQTDIGGALGVTYKTPAVEVSGSLSVSDSIKNIKGNTSTTLSYYRSGGQGNPVSIDMDTMDTMLGNFANQVTAAPFAYKIIVVDYSTLPNYGANVTMPSLSGLDLVAWEYGKAQSLQFTASAMANTIRQGQGGNNYLLGRWGYKLADVSKVADDALNRAQSLAAIAQSCLQNTAKCTTTIYDDLTPRAVFPLPIDPNNVSETLTALWGTKSLYDNTMKSHWMYGPNNARCQMNVGDKAICRPSGPIDAITIASNDNGSLVAFEFIDKPGYCLTAQANSFSPQAPCPSDASSPQFFYSYDKVSRKLAPQNNPKNCMRAIRWPSAYPAGTGYISSVDCNTPAQAGTEISQGWEFRASSSNDAIYPVVSDSNGSTLNNSCVDSASTVATWIAACNNPMRLRFKTIVPATY